MNSRETGRERVLARVRSALGNDESRPQRAAPTIPRTYERTGRLSASERLLLFEERLHEYDADVYRTNQASFISKLTEIIEHSGTPLIAVPPAISPSWRVPGVEWLVDDNLAPDDLERANGALTTATIGIASTGTIILQHGPTEGRRILSLLPDHLFCVLDEKQIVETVPEAIERIEATANRPTTLISGPSATADIEMTRIKGVHGPRNLRVIIVGNTSA